jgi:putative phosphoribosyl transferase
LEEVRIPAGQVNLEGTLDLPADSWRVVVFAHGSGSSRFSPRNRFVAKKLSGRGIGTLLLDLLTGEEDLTYRTRFNINLLSTRLADVTDWLNTRPELKAASVGLFGASTGAAAALQTAAESSEKIRAVISRGGRPDLAEGYLHLVRCPTLLIVGGCDVDVLKLNEAAFRKLTCEKQLTVVPGATHLFEEPGKLEEVSRLASDWFELYL